MGAVGPVCLVRIISARANDVIGYRSEGGYAERVKVPAGNVIPIPDQVEFNEAAAFR